MRLLAKFILIFALFEGFLRLEAANPGLKAKITTKGLDYANDVAIQALKTHVDKTTIPDQNGEISGVKYHIKNIQVTQFNSPTSRIALNIGKGLTWKTTNAYIEIKGDFTYKKWFLRGGGSFTAKFSGVSFHLDVDIGKDNNGRPTISCSKCMSSIDTVDFRFHGSFLAWLYNLFRHHVGDLIEAFLKEKLCELIKNEVNVNAANRLAELQMSRTFAKHFLLDYHLSAAPTFAADYMETYHKGEIFLLTDLNTEAPFSAKPMVNYDNNQKMINLMISDYVFDTLSYVAHTHGFLALNLTKENLPADAQVILDTTCPGFFPKCIGGLIPEIGKKYPNSEVELQIESTTEPRISISSEGVTLNASAVVDMYAMKNGSSKTPFLLSLDAAGYAHVTVGLQDDLVTAHVNDANIQLKLRKSAVGKVNVKLWDLLSKHVLEVFLLPKINEFGAKGFPLPTTNEIKFTNAELSFAQDTIIIATDLKYTPPGERTNEDIKGSLMFKAFRDIKTEDIRNKL